MKQLHRISFIHDPDNLLVFMDNHDLETCNASSEWKCSNDLK